MADEANGALPDWMSFEPEEQGTRWVTIYDAESTRTEINNEKNLTAPEKAAKLAKVIEGKYEVEIDWISRRKQQDMMAPAALTLAGGTIGLRRDQEPDAARQIESVTECQRKVIRAIVRDWRGLTIDIYNSLVDRDDRLRPNKHSDPLVAAEYKKAFDAARKQKSPMDFSPALLDRLLVTALPDKFSNLLFNARDVWAEEQREADELEQPGSPTTSEA